jgi:Tfp pilus assembly protein PilN
VRPVNLTPPEDRRGERAPLRAGSLSYVVIGGLAVALVAVTALVLTGNSINDRKAEVASLEARETAARAEAESLRGFAEFANLSESRTQTVTNLAQSRFDWERVMRELALVIPDDVWLIALSGAAAPGVQSENGAEVSLDPPAGPSLAMIGCATGHEAVARFLQALKDIDGVTRVGIAKSELPTDEESSGGADDTDCRTRDFITRFEILAAFDEVAVPAIDAPAPLAADTNAVPASGDSSGVAEAQAQEQQARDATGEQTGEANEAANLVPGVAR